MRLQSLYRHLSHLSFTAIVLGILAGVSSAADGDEENSRQRSGGPVWGPWGEWSVCSRTCGRGVYYQERVCLSVRDVVVRPERCDGEARVYQSCNIQDCPEGAKDFREEQCSAFNDVPYDGSYYTWVPYLEVGPSQHCQLNCMPKGENFYYTQAETVVDGTRCSPDTLNICVAGICREVGCDMMLDSKVVLDKCGECDGDNSTCKDVTGEFDTKRPPLGEYNDIVTLPVGATSITVKEKHYSGNFLALRSVHGEYFINGDFVVSYPHTFQAAGATFHYERQGRDSQGPIEVFQSTGPLTEAVVVMLLTQAPNSGVTYEYSVPVGYEQADPFVWSQGSYGECSVQCGGGVKHREVYCTRRVTSEVIADYYCSEVAKPSSSINCNTDLCPPSWFIGDWSECPRTCAGDGVMQQRSVVCMRSTGVNEREDADPEDCLRVAGPGPDRFKNCNEDVPCPHWSTGEWSQCSEPCGPGVQTRTVSCERVDDAGNPNCNEAEKPAEEQVCVERPCSDLKWMVASDWTKCSGSCGEAMQSREIVCVDLAGEAYPEEACVNITKPEIMQHCEPKKDKCKPKWVVTDWTECSASCGKGVRSRFAFCASLKKHRWVEVPSKRCKGKKPSTMEGCASQPCQKGTWMTGDWSQCSASCGVGKEERSIMCFMNGNHGDEEHCKKTNRPNHVRKCVNAVSCPGGDKEPVTSPVIEDFTVSLFDSGERPGVTSIEVSSDDTPSIKFNKIWYAVGDFCSIPVDAGPCREFEVFWYYDTSYGHCARFWYGGCDGNDNRFSTRAACEAACIEDHERLTQEELCSLPKNVGPCRGSYPSFYYNKDTGSCESFIFGGCLGNQNRFSGEDECEIICGSFNKDPCSLQVDSGRCQESHQMWYYEIYSDSCLPFVYSGCFGNPNRFASKAACEGRCVQQKVVTPVDIPEGGINVCSLPVETGRCSDRTLKWFYNMEYGLCESFTYSGCQGNENNFETQDKCLQMCSSGVFIIFPDATTTKPTTPEPTIKFTVPPIRQPSLGTDPSGTQGVLHTSPFPTMPPRTKCEAEREDRSVRGLIGQFIPRCSEVGLYQRLQCHASTGYCFCVNETTGEVFEESNTQFGEPDCEGLYYSERTAVATTAQPTTPEEFIRLDKPLNNVTRLRLGSRLSLRCQITGYPRVDYQWYKDRRLISDQSDSRVTLKQYPWGSRLIIDDVVQGDSGKYFCQGRNAAGHLTTNGKVTVRARKSDSVEEVPQEPEEYIRLDEPMNNDTNIRHGGRASLRCHITGNPTVDYYWYKDGRRIDDRDSRITFQQFDWGSRLIVDSVSQADAGVYECRGRNAAGVVTVDAFIDVKAAEGEAPVITVDVPHTTTLKSGATFKALCQASGVPTPRITWARDDIPINEYRVGRMSDRAGKLKVQQLVYSDAGEYVCTADNGVGDPVRKAVVLQVVPVNVGQSVVVTAHEGEDVRLPCRSAGDYEVTISWTGVGGRQILGVDDRFTQTRDGSLRISSLVLGDSNSYICTGKIGQSIILSKYYQLNVQADAVIVHPPLDQRASVGELVEFTCDSTGSPIPETRWLLNDVPVVENSRISFGPAGGLTINGVKSIDAGTYTCVVSNGVSTARASAEFDVVDDSEIDPDCVDQPDFADCQLIVIAHLCDVYGTYCCRSCAESRK